MNSNINKLNRISHSPWYWLLLLTGSFAAIAIALFYQYHFEDLPCVLCIHVRLWLSLLMMMSLIGLLNWENRVFNSFLHLTVVAVAGALTERSYQLLGTERGFVFGECNFDLGLPAWFTVDEWLPWLYRVETSCGYTPELLFGITMAEALIVMSVGLLLVGLTMFISSLFKTLR